MNKLLREVHNPEHYRVFPDMEAIDIVRKALTPDEFAGYLKGNILKYRLRAEAKDDAMKDLMKADKYKEWLNEQET